MSHDSSPELKVKRKLVIIAAFKEEAKIAKRVISENPLLPFPCEVEVCGIGVERARTWAQDYLPKNTNASILITGFCGGLSVPTRVGDAIFPTKFIFRDEKTDTSLSFPVHQRFAESMGKRLLCTGARYKAVPLITVDRILENEKERFELLKISQAEAVDMEAGAIVSLCADFDQPYFALKVVSDDHTSDLSGLNEIYVQERELSRGSMGKWLLEHPLLALKMRKNWGDAKESLHKTLTHALAEMAALFAERNPS